MTLLVDTIKSGPYTGNDSTTLFAYNFRILKSSDIKVKKITISTGAEVILTETTDYTVSGVGDESGGDVSYPVSGAPLTTDEQILIYSDTARTQTTDFKNQGAFYADIHEDAFDRAVRMIQEMQDLLGRQPALAIESAFSDLTMEDPVAGKLLGWNSGITGLVNFDSLAGSVLVSSFIEAALDETTLDAFLTELGVTTDLRAFIIAANNAAARTALGCASKNVPVADGNVAVLDGTTGELEDGGQTITQIQTADRARANHTGTQVMSTISDAGALAVLDTVDTAQIEANAITQTEIDTSAVGQAELKTTQESDSTTSTAGVVFLLTNPQFMFIPRFKSADAARDAGITTKVASPPLLTNDAIFWSLNSTALQTNYFLQAENGAFASTAQWEYVQASPPYDMGDGEIPLFVYAIIDNSTGLIESMKIAPDPIWVYNGETNARPDGYEADGTPYQERKPLQDDASFKATLTNPGTRMAALARLRSEEKERMPLTQAIKHADMNDIPHPFMGNDLTGKTVVMLDPVSSVIEDLFMLREVGEDINQLIHDKYINIGNDGIGRVTPAGIIVPAISWKNTSN